MAKANLNVTTVMSVPGAIADASRTMMNGMGGGAGAPEALASSTVPPGMATPQPHAIEETCEPMGGVTEYLNRWAGR